jgi:hypothetical protein
MNHWNDNGYKSRKLWFAVFAIGSLLLGGLLLPAALYGDFVGGVVGIASAFMVGNVATKWASTKVMSGQKLDGQAQGEQKPNKPSDQAPME